MAGVKNHACLPMALCCLCWGPYSSSLGSSRLMGQGPLTRARSRPTKSLMSSHALMPFGGSAGSGSLSLLRRKGSSASCSQAGSAGLQVKHVMSCVQESH